MKQAVKMIIKEHTVISKGAAAENKALKAF